MTIQKRPPLVSVVTPSFNQARFLRDTIRSVIEQDYPNIEYLIVDGGSTDSSVEIIQEYAGRVAWWVSEKDKGQAEAINKGMARANGEIVAWLNSDDLYLPGAVSKAVIALQENPQAGMVFGNAITIDVEGRLLNLLTFPDWGLKDFIGFRIICQPAVFMRRALYEQVRGLDLEYHYMLDHHLWIRLACLAPVKHIAAIWAAARHHAAAKNVAQAEGFGRETIRLLAWMQTQAELVSLIEKNRHQVLAGAHRLNARYLLDGGQSGPALKAYGQALKFDPVYTLHHWHRMVYALLSLMGIKGLERWNFRANKKRRPVLSGEKGLKNWPGLYLEENG
ncbi:MAG TPA: glycosyltransferase family 2 protein [Anaerolineales bacterium]|nr:glycosyltransferase family 2 protein [Anaerolineales bacterium]